MYIEMRVPEHLPDIPLGIIRLFDVEKRNGKYLCRCPFHAEKTPSFSFTETSYHCFGCGKSAKHEGIAIEFEEPL